MTKILYSTCLFFLCGFTLQAQSLHLEPSVGLDNSRMYANTNEIPDTTVGVSFSQQRFSLPVYSLGIARNTRRDRLQTYNLQFVYRNTGVPDQFGTTPVPDPATFAGEQVVMRLSLLFEHLYRLNKPTSHNQFFLGLTTAGGYETFDFKPESSIYYPITSRNINLELGGALRYQLQWNSGWRLFANFGVGVIRANHESYKAENPLVPADQQETNLVEISLGSRWQLRTGVGIPLGKKTSTTTPSPLKE